ncbi:uncharacterized protein [Typha angustifolia]|uniref:uncharacterized protein n=1 Tax=Typha angustifolia TaxID=59011 RepID=UPI003C2EB861
MDNGNTNKRLREDETDESPATSPDAKRLRAEDILNILDDDADAAGGGAAQDLASVMRSLEEEIAVPPPKTETCTSDPVDVTGDLRDSDLGYLLEASDDELGLPPTAPSSSDGEAEAEAAAGEEVEGVGFGQIWGFEDEIAVCYEGLEYGIRPEMAVADDVVGFAGGLFDYPDVAFEPSDFGDLSWRSMPAV